MLAEPSLPGQAPPAARAPGAAGNSDDNHYSHGDGIQLECAAVQLEK
jgi:hypothetical protein